MSTRKKTPEEVARARAAGVAKRYNREQAERAPLFAHAGLTPTITADEAYERRIEAQSRSWWLATQRDEGEANEGFRADWYRYVVWTLVGEPTFAEISAWAEHRKGPVYCRLDAWRTVAARLEASEDPLPPAAMVRPSACWPALRRAIAEGRWHEEKAAHTAAGCTTARCLVLQRDQPPPFLLGSMTLATYEAAYP